MPYNLPGYNVKRISIGPANIYIGVAGATPTIDLGAVYESTLKITSEEDKFYGGAPSNLKWRRAKHVEVSVIVKGLEWNLSTLQTAFGGYFSSNEAGGYLTETYYATGDVSTAISLRLIHQTPSGGTLTFDMFKAVPMGFSDVSFGYAVHQLPYSFSAINSKYDYAGNALPSNTMFKIVFETPS